MILHRQWHLPPFREASFAEKLNAPFCWNTRPRYKDNARLLVVAASTHCVVVFLDGDYVNTFVGNERTNKFFWIRMFIRSVALNKCCQSSLNSLM